MSVKIEISRDLADRLYRNLAPGEEAYQAQKELRSLIAAPVVERQPVAVITGVTSRKDSKFQIVILNNQELHIGTKLYTSPPAQVAPVNESKEFNKWWSATEVLKKNKLQVAQEAWQARAYLDKEPNQ